jgi:hypothetical protein
VAGVPDARYRKVHRSYINRLAKRGILVLRGKLVAVPAKLAPQLAALSEVCAVRELLDGEIEGILRGFRMSSAIAALESCLDEVIGALEPPPRPAATNPAENISRPAAHATPVIAQGGGESKENLTTESRAVSNRCGHK